MEGVSDQTKNRFTKVDLTTGVNKIRGWDGVLRTSGDTYIKQGGTMQSHTETHLYVEIIPNDISIADKQP